MAPKRKCQSGGAFPMTQNKTSCYIFYCSNFLQKSRIFAYPQKPKNVSSSSLPCKTQKCLFIFLVFDTSVLSCIENIYTHWLTSWWREMVRESRGRPLPFVFLIFVQLLTRNQFNFFGWSEKKPHPPRRKSSHKSWKSLIFK